MRGQFDMAGGPSKEWVGVEKTASLNIASKVIEVTTYHMDWSSSCIYFSRKRAKRGWLSQVL